MTKKDVQMSNKGVKIEGEFVEVNIKGVKVGGTGSFELRANWPDNKQSTDAYGVTIKVGDILDVDFDNGYVGKAKVTLIDGFDTVSLAAIGEIGRRETNVHIRPSS